MDLDLKRVAENVRAADTDDLLDRITVYRSGMEPDAIDLIEAELADRGIDEREIQAHAGQSRTTAMFDRSGTAIRCTRCSAPAIGREWQFYRILGIIPVFPMWMDLCREHGGRPPEEKLED